jgi:hypothetical protein
MEPPVIRRSLHVLLHAAAAITAIAVIAVAVIGWRLAAGPISLGFLIPVAENALADVHPELRISFGKIIATWAGWDRALDFRLVDVLAKGADGREIVRLPEVGVSLSLKALARGVIAADEITLVRPSLSLRIAADGSIGLGVGPAEVGGKGEPGAAALSEAEPDKGAPFSDVFGRIAADAKPGMRSSSPLDYLETVTLIDGTLLVAVAAAPPASLGRVTQGKIWREASVIRGEAFIAVADEASPRVVVTARYMASDRRLQTAAAVEGLRPAVLAEPLAAAAPAWRQAAAAVDLPISGTIDATISGEGVVDGITYSLSGAAGELILPSWAADPQTIAGEPRAESVAQPLPVTTLNLEGRYQRESATFDVERLDVVFAEGARIRLPLPAENEVPIAALGGNGRYFISQDRIEINKLRVDLGGPEMEASANFTVSDGITKVVASAAARRVATQDVQRLWPRGVAEGGRTWVIEHLADGTIPDAKLDAAFEIGPAGVTATRLEGTASIRDVTVDYLPPLPTVRNTLGQLRFDGRELVITIAGGQSEGIVVESGSIRFPDLGQPIEHAEIDLTLSGGVQDALRILASPPLRYPQRFGIDPDRTAGTVSGPFRMRVPLLRVLPWHRVDVGADLTLRDLVLGGMLFDQDIRDGNLALKLDKRGMDVTGSLLFAGIATQVAWRENFVSSAPFLRRLQVEMDGADPAAFKALGVELPAAVDGWLSGRLGGRAQLTMADERDSALTMRLDLTNAQASLPPLGWSKAPGVPATIEASGRMLGSTLVDGARFSLSASDLAVVGSAAFGAGGTLDQLLFTRLAHQDTDLEARITRRTTGGWDVRLQGSKLDLGPVRAALQRPAEKKDTLSDQPTRTPPSKPSEPPPDLEIEVNLDALFMGPDQRIANVVATLVREQGLWTLVTADGLVGHGQRVELRVFRGDGGQRLLRAVADDAGEALRDLGLFSDIIGGRLDVDGTFHDAEPHQPFRGRVRIKDFRVIRTPLIARLLSVMALTGILEALTGQGLAFSTFDMPFAVTGDEVTITDAKAYGLSLGLTASGTVDTAAETLDIKGTVVPFYALNAALGRIPLLGGLVTGGEEGGGLFAANYSMRGPLAEPEIFVNPLSLLTPGFLRDIFQIFDLPKDAIPIPPAPE